MIALQQGGSSFHNLVWRWVSEQKNLLADAPVEKRDAIWNRIRKFYDYIEANAEHYGEVPRFEIGRRMGGVASGELEELGDADDEANIYRAAYEGVTYDDTTDDGIGSNFPA